MKSKQLHISISNELLDELTAYNKVHFEGRLSIQEVARSILENNLLNKFKIDPNSVMNKTKPEIDKLSNIAKLLKENPIIIEDAS